MGSEQPVTIMKILNKISSIKLLKMNAKILSLGFIIYREAGHGVKITSSSSLLTPLRPPSMIDEGLGRKVTIAT